MKWLDIFLTFSLCHGKIPGKSNLRITKVTYLVSQFKDTVHHGEAEMAAAPHRVVGIAAGVTGHISSSVRTHRDDASK